MVDVSVAPRLLQVWNAWFGGVIVTVYVARGQSAPFFIHSTVRAYSVEVVYTLAVEVLVERLAVVSGLTAVALEYD